MCSKKKKPEAIHNPFKFWKLLVFPTIKPNNFFSIKALVVFSIVSISLIFYIFFFCTPQNRGQLLHPPENDNLRWWWWKDKYNPHSVWRRRLCKIMEGPPTIRQAMVEAQHHPQVRLAGPKTLPQHDVARHRPTLQSLRRHVTVQILLRVRFAVRGSYSENRKRELVRWL